MVGAALTMASDFLNPTAKLSDPESMRCKLQSSLTCISSDLKTVDNNIGALKGIVTGTYEMVVDLKYKDGIDLIDSNYDVFLKGLKNYNKAHCQFFGFIMELETKANLSFKQQNIRELLGKVAKTRGRWQAKHLASYVFIVRAKYLQIITAFYLYDNDAKRVEEEFESFNSDVKQLQEIHKELFDEEFQPREPLAWEFFERKVPCVAEWCSEEVPLNELLDHINAKHGGEKGTVEANGVIDDDWTISFEEWKKKDVTFTVPHYDFSGHTFLLRLIKQEGIFCMYLRILADQETAKKFMVDLEVMNLNNNTTMKCSGVKVYSVEMKWQDVIMDEDGVLFFEERMAKKLFSVHSDQKSLPEGSEEQRVQRGPLSEALENAIVNLGLRPKGPANDISTTLQKFELTTKLRIKKK